MLNTRTVLAALTLLVPAVLAGPLPKAQVPVTARWILHVDVERLAATRTGAILTNSPATGKAFQATLARYRALLGADPLRDLRSLTVYGEDATGDRGVALIAGNLKADTVTRTLTGYPQHRATPWGAWTLHQWRDAASGAEMNACLHSGRMLIIGTDQSGVAGALNVLNGAKPNLATGKSSLVLPQPRDGVFVTAASRGYTGSEQEPLKALILRNTDSAMMQIGEKAGLLDAGLVLNSVSPDAAFQTEQVLNGLIVTANLTDDDSGLAALAALCAVARHDRQVSVRLNCAATQAAALLARAFMPSR